MPVGRSVLSSSSPSSSADSGVLGAGLSTTGAPTAIAGATLCATRLSGKLNGLIASTGPLGTRRTYAIRPSAAASVSSRSTSPDCWRVSSAAQRNTDTARPTSPLAQNSGLPFSAVISSAISSARSWICRLTEASASARTWIGSALRLGAHAVGSGHGRLDLGRGGVRRGFDERAVVRVVHLERFVAVHPLAGDQHRNLFGHGSDRMRRR